MEWISLITSGLIFPAFWYLTRKHSKLKENELTHMAADIAELKNDVKDLLGKFIAHLENHQ